MMIRKRKFRYALLVLLALALTGCQTAETPPPASEPEPTTVQEPASEPEPVKEPEPEPADDGFTHVSGIEELVEAIAPSARLMLEPGRYSVTDFLSSFRTAQQRDEWNEAHSFVSVEECYDGLELFINGVRDLTITGASDERADTEIVTEPRYAAVLNFRACKNLTVSSLTMGHTDGGDCSGDVLSFYDTRYVKLSNLDLYGCGVFGLGIEDWSGDFYVDGCLIRECEYGPFNITLPVGDIFFTDCEFSDNEYGGWFDECGQGRLKFERCVFGRTETECWIYDEYAEFTDCTFEKVYGPDYFVPEFDRDGMTPLGVDEDYLRGTSWMGYCVETPEDGGTEYLGGEGGRYITLWFDYGDLASLYLNEETSDYFWTCPEPQRGLLDGEGRDIEFTVFLNADMDAWIRLSDGGRLIWLYMQ